MWKGLRETQLPIVDLRVVVYKIHKCIAFLGQDFFSDSSNNRNHTRNKKRTPTPTRILFKCSSLLGRLIART